MEFKHTSVLFSETIENLNIREEKVYVDGTLGGGGHSHGVLSTNKSFTQFFGSAQLSAGNIADPQGRALSRSPQRARSSKRSPNPSTKGKSP